MSSGQRFFYRVGIVAAAAFAVSLFAGAVLFGRFGADSPVAYRDDLDHFKYGSLGSEHEFGIPYWIWRALPELFSDSCRATKMVGSRLDSYSKRANSFRSGCHSVAIWVLM